ncbi:pathogenesis-related protein 1B [Biomphalaria pfeifferi]|uniref:Pathogenesis-related protein 1B n=1 Tax=Biomphalaria pfeifferi TaxID=112525 RepID=A0AAD8BW94_BIOPF|nr:pathogenesis-related protein 1B [Biomphalaria pfeifferi]
MQLALVMTLCFGLVVSDTEIIAISELDDISLAFLKAHNAARANVNVPNLEWSNELSAYAENYAKNCVYGHSYGPYGENLYAGYPKYKLHYLITCVSLCYLTSRETILGVLLLYAFL